MKYLKDNFDLFLNRGEEKILRHTQRVLSINFYKSAGKNITKEFKCISQSKVFDK